MTARGFYTLLFGCAMLFTSLSVGSEGAFLLGAAALLCWLLSLLSVLLARLFCRLEQHVEQQQVPRGGVCRYTLTARQPLPLPIAPLSLRVGLPNGRQSSFLLRAHLSGTTASENDFSCPHVGVYAVGATHVSFSDCFGLFALSAKLRDKPAVLTVLPNPVQTVPLRFSSGEGENSAEKRALSDRTTPADTRLWQEGDELKRIHWKLSMRRGELMVHTYETPQRPDALLLLDCAPPDVPPALRSAAIDALCETCAGSLKELLDAGHIARLPLSGETQRELSGQDAAALPAMLTALAQERFLRPIDFTRVLLLASRRMQRTGSTAIITTRLT
ncbi:MAG: DUF58 domain-containing protein, partial [Clostridia bacterium]|nr:DUF58 domain-containing protein [Clostridia bacterium]